MGKLIDKARKKILPKKPPKRGNLSPVEKAHIDKIADQVLGTKRTK